MKPLIALPGAADRGPRPGGTLQRVLVNVVFLLAGNAMSAVIAMALAMILARYLGAAQFGKYSLIFLYVGLIQLATQSGIEQIVTRELSRHPEDAAPLLGSALALRLGAALMVVAAFPAITLFTAVDREVVWATTLGLSALLFSATYGPYWSLFESRLEHSVREYAVISGRIAELVLIGLAVMARASLLWLVGASVIAQVVPLALTLRLARGRMTQTLRVQPYLVKDLIRQGAPLGAAAFLDLVYQRAGSLLIAWLQGYAAMGLYSAAYKLLSVTLTFPWLVNFALFPVFARFANNRATTRMAFQKLFNHLLLALLPFAVGVALLAPQIIEVLYGAGFEQAAGALRVLIWVAVAAFISQTCRTVLISAGQQGIVLRLTIMNTAVSVLLNLWAIPRFGIVGAAWTMVITEVLAVSVAYALVRRFLGLELTLGYASKAVASALCMGTVVSGVTRFGLLPAAAAGGLCYALAATALKLWPPELWTVLHGRKTGSRLVSSETTVSSQEPEEAHER